jgi:hypothetical protein
MASTYVNDLRLNEMATGDASGSWGTVTNTNLELIGEAFSYGTETIGDADSTLTIADGAADAARSFYLKITSSVDLTTTRIVTLGPNTVSKVWMIENATTGSQVITIKQGSGATINVPNGQVKMISTDGAGSGGAVLDLLVDVDLTGTTTLVNLDVSGTLGVTGVLTATSLDISGDIDVDGTTNLDVVDIDGAVDMASTLLVTGVLTTTAATVSNGGGQFNGAINVGVDDTGYDVKFFGATAGAYMLWDESADDLILGGAAGLSVNSTALVTGVLTTTAATVHTGGITMPDNAKAIFGAGSDLEIYHDGTNNRLTLASANTYIQTDGIVHFTDIGNNEKHLTINDDGAVDLYHNNALKLATTATGIDVTGTVVADGLTVANTGVVAGDFDGGTSATYIRLQDDTDNFFIGTNNGLGSFLIKNETADALRLTVQNNGDISFYEDTGTTAKFFWDASAESLGIGTTSPQEQIHSYAAGSNALRVSGGANNNKKVEIGYDNTNGPYIKAGSSGETGLQFYVDNTSLAATIDSSGNVLVGTTDTVPSNNGAGGDAGVAISPDGVFRAARSGNVLLDINRMDSNGDIAAFRKDGTTVGIIGTVGGCIYIGSAESNLRFNFGGGEAVIPATSAGAVRDNAIDLGESSARFDDIYATNGTIQTSDRNEKQDIETLSEAEQRVAVACKGLLRKFRWKDAVAEKGDDARIHFGIIAQDLQDAFVAEGLDAGRYAMFISSTWWEADRVVPAVEAVEGAEATYDDEGNQLTEAVEAVVGVSEHTVTDTFMTLEEAPEGATERTRLGVRYPELLAFIIGAL